mmetsp:Transcript_40582/g.82999  ORF Transcript_40582/g.82999 Transcript_40582/m.82999 type:complete len:81 (-) Transcript_40582:223-465(-)
MMVVDVSHGGAKGFHQAFEMSRELPARVKLDQEEMLVKMYFHEIKLPPSPPPLSASLPFPRAGEGEGSVSDNTPVHPNSR